MEGDWNLVGERHGGDSEMKTTEAESADGGSSWHIGLKEYEVVGRSAGLPRFWGVPYDEEEQIWRRHL